MEFLILFLLLLVIASLPVLLMENLSCLPVLFRKLVTAVLKRVRESFTR